MVVFYELLCVFTFVDAVGAPVYCMIDGSFVCAVFGWVYYWCHSIVSGGIKVHSEEVRASLSPSLVYCFTLVVYVKAPEVHVGAASGVDQFRDCHEIVRYVFD